MNDPTDSYNVTADQAHDDKWLADQVVALEVGWLSSGGFYHFGASNNRPGTAKAFVRDPRVAMALMEKALCGRWCSLAGGKWYASANDFPTEGESLPRAITEACVKALS